MSVFLCFLDANLIRIVYFSKFFCEIFQKSAIFPKIGPKWASGTALKSGKFPNLAPSSHYRYRFIRQNERVVCLEVFPLKVSHTANHLDKLYKEPFRFFLRHCPEVCVNQIHFFLLLVFFFFGALSAPQSTKFSTMPPRKNWQLLQSLPTFLLG